MTAVCIVLSLVLLLVAAAALVDIVPAAAAWLGRIGMGRLSGEAARDRIAVVAVRWLHKTPWKLTRKKPCVFLQSTDAVCLIPQSLPCGRYCCR